MSQNDRTQLIPDPQKPSRQTGGVQAPRPIAPAHNQQYRAGGHASQQRNRQAHQQHQQYQGYQQHPAGNNAPNQGPSHARHNAPTDKRGAGKKSGKKTTLFVVLGLVAIVYIVGVVAFSQVAYPNTTIAGVDVSLSNASSAATKVSSAWKHYKLTVTGDDFSWTYQPESEEPIVDGEAAAKEIIGHNEAFIWPVRLVESLSGKTNSNAATESVDLDQDVDLSMLSDAFDQKQFEEDLGAAIDEFNDGRSGTFEASSSYDEDAGKFTVEKARSNEKINREHVIKYAEIQLAALSDTVDINKIGNDAYEPLNGTLTNDQIQAACDAANNFLGVNVTLKLNGEDAGKVDGSSVLQWISFADPANPTLDTSQISGWAAEFANGFNTVGSTRWWKRADGKECAVEGGDYGWSIDSDTLAKQVEDAINNKQTGEIEISYSKKADTFTAKGEPDWKAYIDVDLSEQHARYYDESGNIVWEANFISGKPGEDATPEGVWQINSNDGGSTLIGAKDPETGKPKYESPVSYWMPFEGNMIGFHDATWQNDKSFDNAESYKWCGSHGCINLRLADAKALHDCIKVGLCVVVHS